MSSTEEINIDEEDDVRFYDGQNAGYDEESVYAEIAAYEETSKVQSDLLYVSQHAGMDIPWAIPQPALPKVDRPVNYASLLASHNLIEVDDSDDDSDDDDSEIGDNNDAMVDDAVEVQGKQRIKERTSKIVETAAMAMPWLTEDEDGSALSAGPPRTKNEVTEDLLVVEDLSGIVIDLDVDRLELIGEVLYTLDSEQTIIVQASYTNNPLNEGSVLCNKEGELLGKIYEVFGPVTSPFYTVKVDHRKTDVKIFYNKFQSKAAIYCVWKLSTFVTPALLMQRGTDASNMYDEEITEEQEFSDDEKELEARQAKNKAAKQKKQPTTIKTTHTNSSHSSYIQQTPIFTAPILTIPNNMTTNNINNYQALPWAGFQQPPSAPQLHIQPSQEPTSQSNYQFTPNP